jgi:hypothetical protein
MSGWGVVAAGYLLALVAWLVLFWIGRRSRTR